MKAIGKKAFVDTIPVLTGYVVLGFGLLAGDAHLATVALTTFMVNARHLFYGISMLEKYKDTGKRKGYLVFSLTDETYSLVCRELPLIPKERRKDYYLWVSVLNHFYWVTGSVFGLW